MAKFKTHIVSSAFISGAGSIFLYDYNFITSYSEVALLILAGTIGGILPDMDSPNSKPLRYFFELLSAILSFLMVFTLMDNIYFEYKLSSLETIGIWIGTFFAIKLALYYIYPKFVKHRGIIHSIPFGLVSGMVMVQLLTLLSIPIVSLFTSLLIGIFVTIMFLFHLILDEVCAINIVGNKPVKSSFGSAFKFYDKSNHIGSLLVYLILFIQVYLQFNIEIEYSLIASNLINRI